MQFYELVKFSIILPVKNGGEYVKECVRSILAQQFKDFELIVLDNNSTDGTLEWLYSVQDSRIKIVPSKNSLTIEENWGRIKSVKKGEFITLIGHDDILRADYLTVMNELIMEHPSATLYQAHFDYIDSSGKKIRECKPMKEIENAADFLANCLQKNIDLMGTGFITRALDYDAIGGIPDYPSLLFADFELWINLTRKGYKATSTKNCFAFRVHHSTTSTSTDIKMNEAFERFIAFLVNLKNEDIIFKDVIMRYSGSFLGSYCKGFVHRVLRTPRNNRNGISVDLIIKKFKLYADLLSVSGDFKPSKNISIRLAKAIDRTQIGRSLFLLFKKFFPKPVLK